MDIWSIWNEANLYSWLSPQRVKGVPVSPGIYRGLYLAGHRGLETAGHGGDTILFGELMPRGGGDSRKVRPLEFLREMVCLDRNYRQYRGKAARKRGCRRVGRIPTRALAITRTAGRGSRSPGRTRTTRPSDSWRACAVRWTPWLAGQAPTRLPIWITVPATRTVRPIATPRRSAAPPR